MNKPVNLDDFEVGYDIPAATAWRKRTSRHPA